MNGSPDLVSADLVIAGGGTAGCALTRLLLDTTDLTVVLLEAGPDYGRQADGRWPEDLVDPRSFLWTHDWGYSGHGNDSGVPVDFWRARVIGGCSAHNGCEVVWGCAADYDGWDVTGWSADDLRPLFEQASATLRVTQTPESALSPVSVAFVRSAAALSYPLADDLASLDNRAAISPIPRNISEGVRWSTAFAYLDEVRDDPRLTIVPDALVDRIELRGDRARGVHYHVAGEPQFVHAARVVVAGGVYGSPAILLRSGIGPPAELADLGIAPLLDLPGVGRNLHDHPQIELTFRGSDELGVLMTAWSKDNPSSGPGQLILKAPSTECIGGYDHHIWMNGGMPLGGTATWTGGRPFKGNHDAWRWQLGVSCLTPRSRGSVTLRSTDPSDAPRIDHAYLSDPDGHDVQVLVEGVEMARRLTKEELGDLFGDEQPPTAAVESDPAIRSLIRRHCVHYWHPVGTCAMGTGPAAVVDSAGRVHGTQNLHVADASIMPTVPRANTNLPTVVIGHRIAEAIRGEL